MPVLQAMAPAWAQVAAAESGPPVHAGAIGLSIPALTPVLVKFDEEVSSEKNHRGDRVRISIAEDVLIDGHVVIPAASAGEAEVVHVVPITTGGQPGELTVAARFVRVGSQVVQLRSLQATGSGKGRVGSANGFGVIGRGLASPLLTAIAATIKGGAMVIAVNTIAAAKTATVVELPAPPAVLAPPQDAPSP